MVASANVFAAGHAQASDWETAVQACLEQVSPLKADYTLGFVYVTDALAPNLPLILERLREATHCLRNREAAAVDLERVLGELTRADSPPPRAGVYVSCIARGAHLFGPGSVEMGIVHRTLGEIPLAGFYANGEISNNRVYTYTGVLSVFF